MSIFSSAGTAIQAGGGQHADVRPHLDEFARLGQQVIRFVGWQAVEVVENHPAVGRLSPEFGDDGLFQACRDVARLEVQRNVNVRVVGGGLQTLLPPPSGLFGLSGAEASDQNPNRAGRDIDDRVVQRSHPGQHRVPARWVHKRRQAGHPPAAALAHGVLPRVHGAALARIGRHAKCSRKCLPLPPRTLPSDLETDPDQVRERPSGLSTLEQALTAHTVHAGVRVEVQALDHQDPK